ncbi:MAG: IS200/IS605 family transposase [Chitinophagaceae bacterium]|nr:IS200/IS605 family transposase [Chitinophagaceae bacterium]
MANTYTQLQIHIVFAVKYRKALIQKEWKERLHQFTTGIVQQNKHKMLQVNSMPDHIHILIGLHPTQALSALVQNIKTETSKWIKAVSGSPFEWQGGFAAFSCSKRHTEQAIRYIINQEAHHHQKTFMDEYRKMLLDSALEFDERYLFTEPE